MCLDGRYMDVQIANVKYFSHGTDYYKLCMITYLHCIEMWKYETYLSLSLGPTHCEGVTWGKHFIANLSIWVTKRAVLNICHDSLSPFVDCLLKLIQLLADWTWSDCRVEWLHPSELQLHSQPLAQIWIYDLYFAFPCSRPGYRVRRLLRPFPEQSFRW